MDHLPKWWEHRDCANEDEQADWDRHRATDLINETKSIEERQSAWHELNLWNATLYTNRELIGFRWGEVQAERELWPTNLRTENIIEQIGEAMLSKAASSPLKPSLVPHGNSLEAERAVRILDGFLFGVWRQVKAEDACVQMFRDAFMSGLGCVRVAFDSDDKTLHVESVFFDNLIIDNRECANRSPPRTYRVRQVLPRSQVEARYGCTLNKQGPYVNYRDVGDGWVVVVEAWRLPDSKGKGGRYTIACCGQILSDVAWKHDWVPLVFFHWQDRTSGFFCKSGVEQIVPYQVRQNELNDDIKEAQDLCCRPRLTLHANSQIDVSQWDNDFGRILLWSGSKPENFEWRTNIAELYQERRDNKAGAFSAMGISEMFANADLAPGVRLDSSAGVREFRNMEDGRHLRLWANFEAARLNVARTILKVLSISKGAAAYKAVHHPDASNAGAESIPYEAVKDLMEDEYSWTMEATPLSALSPAARRELIRDWTSRGLLQSGSEEAKRMEGHPNLEFVEDQELAGRDDILRHLSIVEEGDYEAPTELTYTQLGVKMFRDNYHRLKRYEDVKPAVLQNHIKWIARALTIQKGAAMAQQAQAAPTNAFAPTQGMPGTNATTLPPPV